MTVATQNVILGPGFPDPVLFANSLVVLYENNYRIGTVTASNETEGGEKENAYQLGTTNDFWKPSGTGDQWLQCVTNTPKTYNAVCITAQNLYTIDGGIRAEYSTDNGSTWIPVTAVNTLSNRRPYMMVFNPVSTTHFRVLFTNHTSDIRVGVLAAGEYLTFPRSVGPGYAPPYLNQDVVTTNPVSPTGALLGTSERLRTTELLANIDLLKPGFVYGDYQKFADSAVKYPFFWSANDVDANEVFYGRAITRPAATWTNTTHLQAQIRARGFY